MLILRIIGKIFAVPLIIIVSVLKWIAITFHGLTGWIFRILAIITFLTAIVTYLMQISTGGEALRMLIGAFIIFALPSALGACAIGLGRCQLTITRFLQSQIGQAK